METEHSNVITPSLTVLNQDQINTVHTTALTILEKTGIQVEDSHARDILTNAIGPGKSDGNIIIPKDIIEWAVSRVPAKVDVFDRDEHPAFSLDSRSIKDTIFGIGVTNLFYQNPLDDTVVPFGREHIALSSRLGHGLAEFNAISTPGVIQDVPTETAELVGFLEMLANTSKPIILLISKTRAFKECLELFDNLVGFTTNRPCIVPYLNPITPLILNAETTQKLDIAIEYGLPVIYSNYGMSGATTPITSGGTLALMTAELLAGLVYSQLCKEGTPVILGSLPTLFDMQTMEGYYSPQSLLINLACAEMMAHYQVPHCGTSGGWMGWGPDLMASTMLWINHLTGVLGKVGLVPFVGNNFDSQAFSPATVIYAAEVIRLAREFKHGFSLDEADMGLDEIIDLGPGANYLSSNLTLKKFRDHPPFSRIWPTYNLEKWGNQKQPKAGKILREYTHSLLGECQAPEDHERILFEGEKLVQEKYGSL